MPLYKLSDTGDAGKKKAIHVPKKIAKHSVSGEASDIAPVVEAEQVVRKRKKLAEMSDSEKVDAAKDTILNILSMVAKSRKQLFDRLLEKGYTEDTANLALDRLAEVGVVDDNAFASQWAQSRHNGSGLAPYAIKRELILKGIDEDIIENILSDFTDAQLEDKAFQIARIKARTVSGDKNAKIKKIASAVARKGYSSALSFKVAKEVLEEQGESTEDFLEDSV